nr:hypothetical protein Iba_chr02aCG2980 [Ipomoea batatas]
MGFNLVSVKAPEPAINGFISCIGYRGGSRIGTRLGASHATLVIPESLIYTRHSPVQEFCSTSTNEDVFMEAWQTQIYHCESHFHRTQRYLKPNRSTYCITRSTNAAKLWANPYLVSSIRKELRTVWSMDLDDKNQPEPITQTPLLAFPIQECSLCRAIIQSEEDPNQVSRPISLYASLEFLQALSWMDDHNA